MKTAVLISGQMRTFASCVANLNWQVFRKLPDPTFFISCADDDQARDAYLLEGYYKNVHVEVVQQPELPEPPFSLCRHSPYAPTPNNPKVIQPILRQLWHYRRVWEFFKEKAGDGEHKFFDIVVRCRPDLHFHRFDMPATVMANEFYGPWKATCGGVNDRFSVMGWNAAPNYFKALNALPQLLEAGCPLHPESIQEESLHLGGATIRNTLMAEFTCLRLPGAGDHVPLVEYPGELARFLAASLPG